MHNEERLMTFLYRRWEELGKPEALSLSASEIAKEWTLTKNERTVVVVPVEKHTTRSYVARLLKKLEKMNRIRYETEQKTNPRIKIL